MTTLFKRIRKRGYLMVSYTFLKLLGVEIAIVLERLLTEYNHACNNDLLYRGYFFTDITEISFHIGISEEIVTESVFYLKKIGIINFMKFSDNTIICKVDEEELVNFEKTKEIENDYKMWNYKLYPTQKLLDYFLANNSALLDKIIDNYCEN